MSFLLAQLRPIEKYLTTLTTSSFFSLWINYESNEKNAENTLFFYFH